MVVHSTLYGLWSVKTRDVKRANKILSPKFKIPTHIRSSSHNHIIFHAYSVMLAIFVWGANTQNEVRHIDYGFSVQSIRPRATIDIMLRDRDIKVCPCNKFND